MSFQSLNLKTSYNSSRDNLIDDFYNPVLAQANVYYRTTGFFSSKSLILAAKGLKNFIKNNGKMKLLCGAQLSKEDIDAVLNADEIAKKISDTFLQDIENIHDKIDLNYLKLLSWMVANDFLEIKIGIVKDEMGYVGGIFHEKTGILEDNEGNLIVFSGSNNETFNGWSSRGKGNIEKFKVYVSWEDKKFMEEDIADFDENWNNKNEFLEVFDIPIASKMGLIKLAPKNFDEVMNLNLNEHSNNFHGNNRKLREYQDEAIQKWIENGNRGILEMATGTGKTFTAINCIDEVFKKNSNIITVIACPYSHLCEQWASDIENFFDCNCYNVYSSVNPYWKKDLTDLIFDFNLGIIEKPILLTTHTTLSLDFFIKEIEKVKFKSLVVVDEVHHIFSKSRSNALLEKYDFRLGLSATLETDNAFGNIRDLSYFGDIVYSFDMSEALNSFDEEGNSYLTPYDYFPIKVNLNNRELNQYEELSDKISSLYIFNKDKMSDSYKNLLIQRKNVIKNANMKYETLRKILREFDEPNHLIIFCSSQQIKTVLEILKEENINAHKFTQNEGSRRSQKFGGLSEREYLIEKFDEGFYKALVAIKCLDEGVDVPSANKVIIMSSSNNPAEYNQRRGRVLRQAVGKEKATIFDMVVIEYDYFGNLVESIVESEKNRMLNFIENSKNQGYTVNLLNKWGIL